MQQKSAWLLSGALALLTLPHTAQADAIGDNNICYAQFATGNYGSAIDYCSRAIGSGELGEGDLVAALINRGVAYKSSGDLVSAGTPVAVSGDHDGRGAVHASARINGVYVDPVPLWGCVATGPVRGLRLVPVP